MTFTIRSVTLAVAAFAIGSTLPQVMENNMRALAVQDDGTIVQGTDGSRVRLYPAPRNKSDYERALIFYRIYLQKGRKDLVRPNINDRASIDFYLNNPVEDSLTDEDAVTAPLSVKDYVLPVTDVEGSKGLNQQERNALTISRKIGKCITNPNFSAGYLDTCRKIIAGKKAVETKGIGSDLMNIQLQKAQVVKKTTATNNALFDGLKDNRTGASRSSTSRIPLKYAP